MTIKFYHNSAEDNKIDKTAFLTNETVIQGTLRENCNVERPAIKIQFETFPTFNYVYIQEFNRYYFISSIDVLLNNLYIISLDCDVLMSFKSEILALQALIARNEYIYNSSLIDSLLPAKINDDTTLYVATNNFFNTSLTANDENVVLTCYAS